LLESLFEEIRLVDYNGIETLAALEGAANYNNAIEGLLVREASLVAGCSVLDVGSGSGEYARRMRQLGAALQCVEPDPAMRSALLAEGFECHESIANIDTTFDLIVMVNVLEHIEHDSQFLVQLRPLMSENGRLFVFVPAHQMLYSKFDKAIGHFRRYSKGRLHAVVNEASFVIKRSGAFDILGIVPALLFRLLGKERPGKASIKIFDTVIFPISKLCDRVTGRRVGKNLWIVAS
jgi:SAM-dependent methyltransferase